ncbi:hypothetical protein [Acetobacterium wieringae]|uniref:hypothetical protein n=1 Tax=Acetobacterium wieringae TaxID=52694 RepID=UPI0026F1A628|nr:hypothetical protein [Acetobacterium wieringae]
MEKNEIIASIARQYEENGIACKVGGETDLSVNQELMDAKHATGKIKIHYENLILLKEAEKTIYFWELSKEIKSGFSVGFSSESFSQSGATLSRKVKAVQYSTDGKVYEYNFDLGQFNKIAKTVAKENGWKFKVVLSKKKALY